MTAHKPPKHLSAESSAIWTDVLRAYSLGPEARAVLLVGCEAFDRMRAAQVEVDRDGITTPDRYGSPRLHPALSVEARARSAFLAAIKQLPVEDADALDLRYQSGRNRARRDDAPPDDKGRVRPRLTDLERTYTE